jgi:DNA-binding XRE family transcriptional regulator
MRLYMSAYRKQPSSASLSENNHIDDGGIRSLLKEARLSQRAAAKYLKVDDRTMRGWCSEDGNPPAPVLRALNPKHAYAEGLIQMIVANKRTIKAIEEGRISGLGDGSDPETKTHLIAELEKLKARNEEHDALLRLDQAFYRRQEAMLRMNEQWLPRGSGVPSEDLLDEFDAAEEEFRAAQAECDRIASGIRTGKR